MATKSFIKTIGSKGLLADYNTEGKKLQTELTFDTTPTAASTNPVTSDGIKKELDKKQNNLTAGNLITIANNVISAANVLEPKDISNDPNKDFNNLPEDNVLYYKNSSTDFANQPKKGAYRFIQWTSSLYYSIQIAIDGNNQFFARSSYRKSTGGTGKTWNHWIKLQENLTFDSAPTAGSNNPVTSDGIYNSMYNLPTPATPSSFTKDGKSYSFVCRTKVSAWTRSAFEGYAFPVDWTTFDMIRIRTIVYSGAPTVTAIASITCGRNVYEKFNFVQAVYNGYCYIFATNPYRPLYINPNKYLNSDTNSSSITQDIFEKLTLTKIEPSIDDVIFDTTPTAGSKNPVTSDGIKTALDKKQNNLTAGDNITISADSVISADKQIFFATYGVTTYDEIKNAMLNGVDVIVKKDSNIFHSIWIGEYIYFESVVANPRMIRQAVLKNDNTWAILEIPLQGKLTFDTTPTADSTNPVTSDGIKTALDSRIPAPTSTTGTQVLKCIDGVIQWVTE